MRGHDIVVRSEMIVATVSGSDVADAQNSDQFFSSQTLKDLGKQTTTLSER